MSGFLPPSPIALFIFPSRKHHLAVKKSATSVLDELTAPFDEDSKQGKNFPPHVYLRRLQDATPGLYSIKRSAPVVITVDGVTAISVVTNIEIEVEPDVTRTYSDVGAAGIEDGASAKDIADAIKIASSDSLKRAMLAAGVNLETYENGDYEADEAEEEKPKRRGAAKAKKAPVEDDEDEDEDEEDEKPKRRAKPAAKPARGGKGWTGEDDIGFGANKDVAWKDIHGSWLQYCLDNFDDGPNLTKVNKEIERRGDDFDPEEGDGKKPAPKRRASGRTGGKGKY
jgi:hypothetical protein